MPQVKSPLRYPGGKSRLVPKILRRIPADIEVYAEPFVGGGSVALNVAKTREGLPVLATDYDAELIKFWQAVQVPEELGLMETELLIYRSQSDEYLRAVLQIAKKVRVMQPSSYYMLNRCSVFGAGRRAGLPKSFPRFNHEQIQTLCSVHEISRRIQFSCKGFPSAIEDAVKLGGEKTFLYVDPPYYGIKGLYFHQEIDQKQLRRSLDWASKQGARWLLSMNDCREVRELYLGRFLEEIEVTSSMKNGGTEKKQTRMKELFISNYYTKELL